MYTQIYEMFRHELHLQTIAEQQTDIKTPDLISMNSFKNTLLKGMNL